MESEQVKISFRRFLGLIALVALVLLLQFTTSSAAIVVHAPLLSAQTDCVALGGSWNGSSDEVGTCTYPANLGVAIQACGSNSIYTEVFDIDFVKSTFCQSEVSANVISWNEREPEPDLGKKCKLIDIDSSLSVGGTFNAKWTGVMNSIRFRQPQAGLEFISAIPGSLTYEQVHPEHNHQHRSADFANAFLLQPGRWEASCWGPDGTFGTPFVVLVD